VTALYFENLVDAVTDDDREWFDQHPHAPFRFRPYVPGELVKGGCELRPMCDCGPPAWTRVTRLSAGARIRVPVFMHSRQALRCDGHDYALVVPHG